MKLKFDRIISPSVWIQIGGGVGRKGNREDVWRHVMQNPSPPPNWLQVFEWISIFLFFLSGGIVNSEETGEPIWFWKEKNL